MITAFVLCSSEEELEFLYRNFRECVSRLCDDRVELKKAASLEKENLLLEEDCRSEVAFIDITGRNVLSFLERYRVGREKTYLVLISDLTIPPTRYMRPSIRAESLILKPVRSEATKEVIQEVVEELVKRRKEPSQGKIIIDNQDGRVLIDYDDIYYIESRCKKIYVNIGSEEYGFYSTMEMMQEKLGGQFLRCHRSFLVNTGKIEKIMFSKNAILLSDEFEIPISRGYRQSVRDAWGG